jgi:predicted ATPase
MRFLDFDPPALRVSSKVGQTTLGDRGQNLASVLMDICRDEQKKATIVDWLETLTPMDAQDIRFEVAEHSNEVTLILVEQDGTETPSYSASDGTLRFLGLLALLFQPSIVDGALVSMSLSDRRKPPRFLFLEEIETGLHPTRLALLANLIEQRTRQTDIQVVATTHSPQFLQVLDDDTLEDAQLVYRTGDGPEAKICPLLDVPDARKVLAKPNQSVGELHETGWFERVMAFSGGEGVPG